MLNLHGHNISNLGCLLVFVEETAKLQLRDPQCLHKSHAADRSAPMNLNKLSDVLSKCSE